MYHARQYKLSLQTLKYEGGIMLHLERGDIPSEHIVALTIRLPSKECLELEMGLSRTLQGLLDKVCKASGLESREHKLYKTDWSEEAVKVLCKTMKSL